MRTNSLSNLSHGTRREARNPEWQPTTALAGLAAGRPPRMRYRFASALLLAFFLGAGLAASPGIASAAKKRVVVLPFSGPGGATARAALVRGIKRKVRLLALKTYRRTATRLGVDGNRGSGLATTAAKLKVSAVIAGEVVKQRRGRFKLVVTVYNGADGEVLGESNKTVRGRRRLRRAGAGLGTGALRWIRQGQVGSGAPAPVAAPPPARAPEEVPPLRNDGVAATPPARQAPARDRDDDDDATAKDKPAAAAEGGYAGLVAVEAALGFSSRSYSLTATDPNQDRKYSGALYPELSVGLEAYPLLLFGRGFASGFGLGLSYSRHLSITTKQREGGQEVGSSSSELLINLRYRWLFGPGAAGSMLYGFVGYGARSFGLDPNPTLTSFDYQFIQIALGGRYAFLGDYLGADLLASARPLLKVGQEAVDAFGEKTGGFGWSARAGLSGRLAFGLTYSAQAELIGFSSDFKGLSARTAEVDSDVASSGSDFFVRFWLGLGYAL